MHSMPGGDAGWRNPGGDPTVLAYSKSQESIPAGVLFTAAQPRAHANQSP